MVEFFQDMGQEMMKDGHAVAAFAEAVHEHRIEKTSKFEFVEWEGLDSYLLPFSDVPQWRHTPWQKNPANWLQGYTIKRDNPEGKHDCAYTSSQHLGNVKYRNLYNWQTLKFMEENSDPNDSQDIANAKKVWDRQLPGVIQMLFYVGTARQGRGAVKNAQQILQFRRQQVTQE